MNSLENRKLSSLKNNVAMFYDNFDVQIYAYVELTASALGFNISV